MKKDYLEDPFLHKQPTYSFEELNAPLYSSKPENWNRRQSDKDEAKVSGVAFDFCFPDKDRILETAYSDLERFVNIHCAGEGKYIIRTRFKERMQYEEYLIDVSSKECVIYASDTEGIRRALYYIEDEMKRRGGAYLPLGQIHRKPHIKKRITRNFYTPHQANLELKDDRDYYPDNYLSRLSHEGVNGLWMFVRLRDFVPSDIIPEYGIGGERQLEKLRSVVKKCSRYGIGVYCLGVEPASAYDNPILEEKHPDMLGATFWNTTLRAVCPSTPKGKAYAEECMYKLFSLVPGLAGFISITTGEAVAGCGGVGTADEINCPRCRAAGLSKPEALALTEEYMQKGIKKANPHAEFISWTYGARSWTEDMLKEHCRVRNKTIALMNNFEDKGTTLQLGKKRKTLDYWLSFAGPGELFTIGADNAGGAPVYAKIQVCSSHELATVPYVPVPGVLYDKYSAMKAYGTEGAMYCWFFGNYPGVMNRAAGELGFLPFPPTKTEFLKKLALLYTDEKNAETLARVWELFEQGYTACPYNVLFAWYGPINDAVARPLHLLPIDMALPSNWVIDQSVEGDRFGEFVGMVHSPEEARMLLDIMKDKWHSGLELLRGINVPDELRSISEAIAILIDSAYNMIDFYILRNDLGYGKGDICVLLSRMETIIKIEMENSKKLIDICDNDKRLGYHSEAVGFKFFPEKLRWRISRLEETLNNEFPQVLGRIEEGRSPLGFFDGEESRVYDTSIGKEEKFVLEDGTADDETTVSVESAKQNFVIRINANHSDDIVIEPEFTMFVPYVPVRIKADGSLILHDPQEYFLVGERFTEESAKWKCTKVQGQITITLDKKDFGLDDGRVFRMAIKRDGCKKSFWHIGDTEFFRLAYGRYRPSSKVFIK